MLPEDAMKRGCSQPIKTLASRQARFLEAEPFLSVSKANEPSLRVSMQALRARTLRLLFSLKDSTDWDGIAIVMQGKDSTFLLCGLAGDLAES